MEVEEVKYYTPDLEELHIGFEVEFCSAKGIWVKSKVGAHDIEVASRDFNQLKKLDEKFIRVKQLDQEDIEQCGWKMEDNHKTIKAYRLGDYMLLHGKDVSELSIFNGSKDYFRGTIRNISELRKVMKMVGITTKK